MDFNQIQMKLLSEKDSKRYCLEHSNKLCNVKCLCLHYNNAKCCIIKYAWTYFFFSDTETHYHWEHGTSGWTLKLPHLLRCSSERPRLRTPEKEPVSQREALGSKPYPCRIKEHTSLHWLLPASWHPEWSLHDGKSGPQIRTTFDFKVKCMLRWNEVTGGIWVARRLLLFCSHSLISGHVAHWADCCHNWYCDLYAALMPCRCTLHLWTILKNIIYNMAEFCFCTYEDKQVCLISMTLLKQTAYVLFPSQPHYPSLESYIQLSLLFMIIHSVLTKNTQENTQFKSGEILVRY